MTTIVWDGKQLVGDSRWSHIDGQVGSDCQKIFAPSNFFLQDEPVLALGLAGDKNICDLVHERIASGCQEPLELSKAQSLYERCAVFDMLVVREHDLALLRWIPGVEENRLNGRFTNKMIVHEKLQLLEPQQIAQGTGAKFVLPRMGMGLDGKALVTAAMSFDPYTGGDLQVWNPEENDGAVQLGVKPYSRQLANQMFLEHKKKAERFIRQVRIGRTPDPVPWTIPAPAFA